MAEPLFLNGEKPEKEVCPVCYRNITFFIFITGRRFEHGHKENCARHEDNDEILHPDVIHAIMNGRKE